jgi:hypothetical protein
MLPNHHITLSSLFREKRELGNSLRLVLVVTIAACAIGAAMAVDRLAGSVPVTVSKTTLSPAEKACVVSFRVHNNTLDQREIVVFIGLFHSADPRTKGEETKTLCGSTALPLKLRPFENRPIRLTVPTTKIAEECDIEID